jgi:hypothetical protein
VDASLGPRIRAAAPRYLAILLAFALGLVLFLATMTLLVDVIHVTKGLVAWGALAGLVVLGLVALSVVIAIPAYYATGQKRGTFAPRVLLVSGIEGFAFTLLLVARYVVNFFLTPVLLDFVIGGAGLAAGAICTVLAARGFAEAKKLRHLRQGPAGSVPAGAASEG